MNERPSESSPSQIQAIFLVTRTRAGPRILVHYPPAPGQGQDVASNVSSRRASTDAQASDLISQDAGVANNKPTVTVQNSSPPDYHDAYRSIIGLEPETIPWRPSTAYSPSSPTIAGLSIPIRPVTASIASDPHAAASILQTTQLPSPRVQQTWTRVLGFPAEGLARMLAPGNRSWHKHKLELQMRDMYFVGCPIFERVEGGWSKNKKRTKDANDMLANDGEEEAMNIESEQPSLDGISRSSTNDTMSGESQDSAERSSTTAGTAIPSKENQSTVSTAAATSFATASSSLPSSNGGGAIDGLATSGPDTLHMFNVVIVLSDPSSPHPRGQSPTSSASVDVYANSEKSVQQIRHQQRVKEIYAHCVKKLARALHIQQKKDGYVWNEVKKIIGVREKAREAGKRACWRLLKCNGKDTITYTDVTPIRSFIFRNLGNPLQRLLARPRPLHNLHEHQHLLNSPPSSRPQHLRVPPTPPPNQHYPRTHAHSPSPPPITNNMANNIHP